MCFLFEKVFCLAIANSFMYENVRNILYDCYNVSNVLENDKSAICARIDCIQRCSYVVTCKLYPRSLSIIIYAVAN